MRPRSERSRREGLDVVGTEVLERGEPLILFQAGSLAALIITFTGNLFGWAEPIWTLGADQSRAVEIGALISLTTVLAIAILQKQRRSIQPQLNQRPIAA